MASITSTIPKTRLDHLDREDDTRGRPGDNAVNRRLNEDADALDRRKTAEHQSATEKARFMMSDISARAGQAVKGAAERMKDAASSAGQAVKDVAGDITGNRQGEKMVDVDLGSTSLHDRQRLARLHTTEHESELLKKQPSLQRQDEMLHGQTAQTKSRLAQQLAPGARTEVMHTRRLAPQQGEQQHALTTDDKPSSSSAQISRQQGAQQQDQKVSQNKQKMHQELLSQKPRLHHISMVDHQEKQKQKEQQLQDQKQQQARGSLSSDIGAAFSKDQRLSSSPIPNAPVLSPTWQSHNLVSAAGSSKIPASAFDAGMAKSMGDIGEKAAKDVQKAWHVASDATSRAAHKVAEKAQVAGHTVKEFFSDVGSQIKEDTHQAADKTAEVSKKAWTATSEAASKLGHTIAEDSKIVAHKVDAVAHKVADSTAQAAHQAKESTGNVAQRMAHAVKDSAKKAGEAIAHAYDKTAHALRHAFEKTGETGAHVAEKTVDGLAYGASVGLAAGKGTVNAAEHATDVVVDKTKAALQAAGSAAQHVGQATVETAKDAVQVSKQAVHQLATKVADKTADTKDNKENKEVLEQDVAFDQRLNSSLARTATDVAFPPLQANLQQGSQQQQQSQKQEQQPLLGGAHDLKRAQPDKPLLGGEHDYAHRQDLQLKQGAQAQQPKVHLSHKDHEHLVPGSKIMSPLAQHDGRTVSDVSTMKDKEKEQRLPHHPVTTQQNKNSNSFGAQRPENAKL